MYFLSLLLFSHLTIFHSFVIVYYLCTLFNSISILCIVEKIVFTNLSLQ